MTLYRFCVELVSRDIGLILVHSVNNNSCIFLESINPFLYANSFFSLLSVNLTTTTNYLWLLNNVQMFLKTLLEYQRLSNARFHPLYAAQVTLAKSTDFAVERVLAHTTR